MAHVSSGMVLHRVLLVCRCLLQWWVLALMRTIRGGLLQLHKLLLEGLNLLAQRILYCVYLRRDCWGQCLNGVQCVLQLPVSSAHMAHQARGGHVAASQKDPQTLQLG